MNSRTERWMPWIIVLVAVLAFGGYLVASARLEGPGFPLDDAWIHQTYAHNMVTYAEWSFIPGKPSGGSTSPLWSTLLAAGHLLTKETPFWWTYLMGLVGFGHSIEPGGQRTLL